MEFYKKLNLYTGWIIFVIASTVYILTTEPTTSFWDCGEYIATACKLEVGHPPGAPLFQMVGRFFSLFAFGNTAMVAQMINIMSALSGGFTMMFLFWIITSFGRKAIPSKEGMSKANVYAIIGAGIVGSLAFTFTDSFWFSAVEGEVYAMSALFTAIVVWAILRWEQKANEKHANRWLILIAFLIGLSIGVHLLNLLAIPAITMIYYFKKYKPTPKHTFLVFVLSLVILAVIMYIIIPWIVKLAGNFELFFVNILGLPFSTGTIIYFILLIGAIVWGINYTHRKRKVVANTILLGLTFILIGYSSFFMLVIRSNANPPINENSPTNAISLLRYLNREQYGEWPLLYGRYFNAPVVDYTDKSPIYEKDEEKGKYVVIDERNNNGRVYDPRFTTLFPRMWSDQQSHHARYYKRWSKMEGEPIKVEQGDGATKTIYKPTFMENLRFFLAYQVDHMYIRYFFWNFVGRQNDKQGHGGPVNGNWLSGIKFIDEARLGPQEDLPPSMQNKARNKFYFLPLILGIIGLTYHWKRNKKDALVVTLLFIMTGLAIVVYLNQYAPQPRERDYAYAASFMAFCIWIGIGVLQVYQWLRKTGKPVLSAILATLVSLLLVPVLMGAEGWDDHDRSERYTAKAIATNYLNSCAPNAIIFCNGDNDTFPLWYAQEVEGIRTDVRVVNLSLFISPWYIHQMKRQVYKSEPLPISLVYEDFHSGKMEYTFLIERGEGKEYYNLKRLFDLLNNNPEKLTLQMQDGEYKYFPTKHFRLPVDSARVIENGTVLPKYAGQITPVEWKIPGNGVTKNKLMMLDILAHNDWERPIYYAVTIGSSSYINLENYFELHGFAYRLVPVKGKSNDGYTGRVNTTTMYDNVMNKFKWGNMNDPDVYLDETNRRMIRNMRSNFGRLASALVDEGKLDSALRVCDTCIHAMPNESIPYDYFVLPIAETYYNAGAPEKGKEAAKILVDNYEKELAYYFSFGPEYKGNEEIDISRQQGLAIMRGISQVTRKNGHKKLADRADKLFSKYYRNYIDSMQ